MYFVLVAELLLGVLAVFGLYTLLRTALITSLVRVAVEVREGTRPEEVPRLLRETQECCLFGRVRIVALLSPVQRQDAALLQALRSADVDVYFVQR
ncbi:MAG: hypothetical protein IKM08_00785 [Clostridia bacterium]|nr:hypothetical protein [Clostridia bacterium]